MAITSVNNVHNAGQASKYGCFLGRTNLKLGIQDIVAIINNNASTKELREMFAASSKITVKNLVDIVLKQSKYSKSGKRVLDLIVDIINNGTDHKRKAILGSNKITAETLVNIIKASRIPLRHSCSSASKYNVSIRPLGLYNYNPKGQIDKQGKNQGLKEVDEDVFYDLDDNYSVYESCQGDDEVIYRDNETFYEAPDDLDGSPSTGAHEGAYGMFGKLFKIIKNFFGY